MIKELDSTTFDAFVTQGNAIVDFHAEWCGPCKMMEPQFKKAAEKLPRIHFGKVDVDEQYELAGRFRVMSIPTTLFFKKGELVDRHTGALTSDMIERKAAESFS